MDVAHMASAVLLYLLVYVHVQDLYKHVYTSICCPNYQLDVHPSLRHEYLDRIANVPCHLCRCAIYLDNL